MDIDEAEPRDQAEEVRHEEELDDLDEPVEPNPPQRPAARAPGPRPFS